MTPPPIKKDAEAAYKSRIKALRAAMREEGLGAMLVSNPQDVAYFTGFLGGDSYLYVGERGKPTIISDARYEEDLEVFAGICRIAMRSGSMFAAVAKLIGLECSAGRLDQSAGVLGIQSDHLTLQQFDALKTGLKAHRLPVSMPTPVTNMVGQLRVCKDALEVKLITKAIRIQEAAMEATLEQIGAWHE